MCKAFGLTPDYVLHRISYTNLIMMSATLPDYSSSSKEEKQHKIINGDQPQSWDRIQSIADRINNSKK